MLYMRKIIRTLYIPVFLLLVLFQTKTIAQLTTQTFNCTGAAQNFTVPPCVGTLTVQAWGAGGGGGGYDTYSGSNGGGGAYATSSFSVIAGQVLTVMVGCGGSPAGEAAERRHRE